MKLPPTANAQDYVGLYVIDFNGQCQIGYTAEEVAILLESEEFVQAKVYKIYRARPDGTMELHGVPQDRFRLESGMFFSCRTEQVGRNDLKKLLDWSEKQTLPCRAKLELARTPDEDILLALIYPAEYEQEMGHWLSASGYHGTGAVDAGISQVERYYEGGFDVLEKQQLWPTESLRTRDREELLATLGSSG